MSIENWHVVGHDWAVDFLRRSMQHRRNRHAYLITGSANIGKNQLAHMFAMALNCTHEDEDARPCGQCRSCRLTYSGNHPDMLYSTLDEKSGQLKIDTIREMMRLLALKPFDSRYRIALFNDFDHAAPRAQDALLKTLEEPPAHAVLILIAESPDLIMPTITSRCQVVPLRPLPSETVKNFLQMHGAEAERATLLARLSGGRIGWALDALHNEQTMADREEALNLLEEVVRGNRVKRFEIAERLDNVARKDKLAIRDLLEIWQTYWRDVLLLAQQTPVKPCNIDRRVQIEQLVQRIQVEDALKALQATRTLLTGTLKTNASVRLALEVLFLDYPGLAR
jgi:DNA polymerase-3 subunit delta'